MGTKLLGCDFGNGSVGGHDGRGTKGSGCTCLGLRDNVGVND